jgi:hypothetical protein
VFVPEVRVTLTRDLRHLELELNGIPESAVDDDDDDDGKEGIRL